MRIFLTGAFGNIGSEVWPLLVERGHFVRALSLEKRRAPNGIEVVQGDVRDRALLDRAVADVDVVVHLAYVIPPPALENPVHAESVNVGGTRALIDACRAAPRPPKLLFASTLDVYGYTQHLPPPRRVTDPVAATDVYSTHKIACEEQVRASGLTHAILRFADVPPIAIRSPHPMMFRLPLATRFEMIHPRDAGLAVANAVDTDAIWGRTLNIGGGARCQLTYGEYLNAFLDAMGIGAFPERAFSTEPYCTDWLDSDESQRLLAYQRHSFEDVVRETAALLGWRAPLARLFRPLVRRRILRMSPHWR
jgi:nucleoside-diphosphate-sugar epimerase